jgi:hypothetical protein
MRYPAGFGLLVVLSSAYERSSGWQCATVADTHSCWSGLVWWCQRWHWNWRVGLWAAMVLGDAPHLNFDVIKGKRREEKRRRCFGSSSLCAGRGHRCFCPVVILASIGSLRCCLRWRSCAIRFGVVPDGHFVLVWQAGLFHGELGGCDPVPVAGHPGC